MGFLKQWTEALRTYRHFFKVAGVGGVWRFYRMAGSGDGVGGEPEASMNFDVSALPEFLGRLPRLFTEGFGGEEIKEILGLSDSLSVEQCGKLELNVTFQQNPMELRIQLVKDDVDAVSLFFFATEPLTEAINAEMRFFAIERGI
jgi:hypothetical protein